MADTNLPETSLVSAWVTTAEYTYHPTQRSISSPASTSGSSITSSLPHCSRRAAPSPGVPTTTILDDCIKLYNACHVQHLCGGNHVKNERSLRKIAIHEHKNISVFCFGVRRVIWTSKTFCIQDLLLGPHRIPKLSQLNELNAFRLNRSAPRTDPVSV